MYWCPVFDGGDVCFDLGMLRFEERARALVAIDVTIAVLLLPHSGTGGHVVGIIKIGHIPDASDSRLVKPSLK